MNKKSKEFCGWCKKEIKESSCPCGEWKDENDPAMKPYLIFREALLVYEDHFKNDRLPGLFSNSLAESNIHCLFFEGTIQELSMLKELMETLRDVQQETTN